MFRVKQSSLLQIRNLAIYQSTRRNSPQFFKLYSLLLFCRCNCIWERPTVQFDLRERAVVA